MTYQCIWWWLKRVQIQIVNWFPPLTCKYRWQYSLQWRQNGCDNVSNHQPHDYLLERRSKRTSKLRATGRCVGIHRWPVNSPHKGPVTRKIFHLMTSSCWLRISNIWTLSNCAETFRASNTNVPFPRVNLGLFNIKMPSYQYRKSPCGDKTISRQSYLHNGLIKK